MRTLGVLPVAGRWPALLCCVFLLQFCLAAAPPSDYIGVLLGQLKDQKPTVRLAAAQQLAMSASEPRAWEGLCAALADADPGVRAAVVRALAEPSDPRAIEKLVPLLQDPAPEVADAVLEGLQRINTPAIVEPLLALVRDGKKLEQRQRALFVLARCGDKRATEPLLALLTDKELRSSSIQALGQLGDSRAVEPLLAIARKTDDPQRWQAIFAIRELGDPSVADTLLAMAGNGEPGLYEVVASLGDPRAVEPMLKTFAERKSGITALAGLRDARAADALNTLLADPKTSAYDRISALHGLVMLDDPRAKTSAVAILTAKGNGDDYLLERAVEASGQLRDSAAVPKLLPLLKHPAKSVRIEVLRALEAIGSPAAIDALLPMARSNADFFDRRTALCALANTPDPRAIQEVIKALSAPDAEGNIDEEAIYSVLGSNPRVKAEDYLALLPRAGSPRIFMALAQTQLTDARLPGAMAQWAVAHGGRWMLDEATVAAFKRFGTPAADKLLAALQKPAGWNGMVVGLLGRLGDPRTGALMLQRVKADEGPSEAYEAVGQLKVKEAYPYLLRAATGEGYGETACTAVRGLGALQDPRAVATLLEIAQEKDAKRRSVREEAARALGMLGDAQAVEPLLAMLNESDARLRIAAAQGLVKLPPDPRAVPGLLAMLYSGTTPPDMGQYAAGVRALARISDAQVVPALLQTLRRVPGPGMHDYVRQLIAEEIGQRKDPQATLVLCAMLRHDERWPAERLGAARSLGQIGDARAVPALMIGVRDPDPDVRAAAASALTAITGQNFGQDHAKWVGWWLETHK